MVPGRGNVRHPSLGTIHDHGAIAAIADSHKPRPWTSVKAAISNATGGFCLDRVLGHLPVTEALIPW